MSGLLPCPFCGSPAFAATITTNLIHSAVRCSGLYCGAQVFGKGWPREAADEAARSAWNRRYTPPGDKP